MRITGYSAELIPNCRIPAFALWMLTLCAGRCRIRLKATDQEFYVVPARTKYHNLMMTPYVDRCGKLVVKNQTTGNKAVVTLTPCKAFGRQKGRINGTVFLQVLNPNRRLVEAGELSGQWNEQVEFKGRDLNNERWGTPYTQWCCPERVLEDSLQRTQFGIDLSLWQGRLS